METEKMNSLKYSLDLLEVDHKEKTKRYSKQNLLSADNVQSEWEKVGTVLEDVEAELAAKMGNDEFNKLPTETKQKAMKMIMEDVDLEENEMFKACSPEKQRRLKAEFIKELNSFDNDLEKYTMIREFAPILMGHLMDKKLGEMQIISSSNTQRHMLLAKETMKYAEALADEVMKRNPDRKYLPDENVQRPENETVKSD